MNSSTTEEASLIAEYCDDRRMTYRLIAALIDREVRPEHAETIRQLYAGMVDLPETADSTFGENDEEAAQAEMTDALRRMAEAVTVFDQDAEDQLACDFARVFLAAGNRPDNDKTSVPFESVYTSEEGLLMQDARDEVREIFRSEGVMPTRTSEDGEIPEDYLTFELQYLALLCERTSDAVRSGDVEGARLALEKQRVFLDEHVLNWVGDLADAVRDFAKLDFYNALMDFTVSFVADDAETIDQMLSAL